MRNKRKGILMASAILGSAAIVSTGFAAWVVSTNVTETATGNIEVDIVNDNRVTISTPKLSQPNFIFGGKGETIANAWLTNDNLNNEVLSTVVTFTPDWTDETKAENITIYTKFEVDGTVWGEGNSDTKSVSYGTGLTLFELDLETTTLPSTGNISCVPGNTQTITIAFKWGTAFGGKNPYVYFNSAEYYGQDGISNTEINEAIARLEALESWKEKPFVISLSNNAGFNKTELAD